MSTPSEHTRHIRTAQVDATVIVYGDDIGRQRATQQDSKTAVGPDQLGHGNFLLVVADGMGGEAGGERASQLVVEGFNSGYAGLRNAGQHPLEAMESVILTTNRNVIDDAERSGRKGMGSTVVAMAYEGGQAWITHVGDSRAYMIDDRGFRRVTTDHTRVQRLIREGILTPQEAEVHPDAHILSQAVGREGITVDRNQADGYSTSNTLFVLCSDGLTGMVPDYAIEMALRGFPPEEALVRLMDLANELDSSDNITIAIASNRAADVLYAQRFEHESQRLLREKNQGGARGHGADNRSPARASSVPTKIGHWMKRNGVMVSAFVLLAVLGAVAAYFFCPKVQTAVIAPPRGPDATSEEMRPAHRVVDPAGPSGSEDTRSTTSPDVAVDPAPHEPVVEDDAANEPAAPDDNSEKDD